MSEPEKSTTTAEDLDLARLQILESVGRADMLRPLIEVFIANAETSIARLYELGPAGDPSVLKNIAHDLAGVAGNYGARRVELLARRLMISCDARDRGGIATTLIDLKQAALIAFAALRIRYPSPAKTA